VADLDFQALEPEGFEEFCFSLLTDMGFVNVDWRRGSPKGGGAPDSGRDIEADLEKTDVDGERHMDRWFVDCKHYENAVPPDALQNLLAWAQAERPQTALFIVSGFLSNPAKDYLRDYEENNRPAFRIKYWERPHVERLAADRTELITRFLLSNLRKEGEILEAESEFFDKVWHERHLMFVQRVEEGKKKPVEGLLETALAAAEKIRENRGEDNLGPYDDFEWGMVNGKLSALRWVLGDEWDFLDT
jgi:hypothetical protein